MKVLLIIDFGFLFVGKFSIVLFWSISIKI